MNIFIRFLMGFTVWFLITGFLQAGQLEKMVICVPVADLRNGMQAVRADVGVPAFFNDMQGQLSQLLMGECILAEPAKDGWLRVVALEQKMWAKNQFYSFTGYIQIHQAVAVKSFPSYNSAISTPWAPVFHKNKKLLELSFGTKVVASKISDEWCKVSLPTGQVGYMHTTDICFTDKLAKQPKKLSGMVTTLAQRFVGSPYVWGGRSAYTPAKKNQITSIDCSSLVNLVFQAIGLRVPRNSLSQFEISERVACGKDLVPGDLLFFAPSIQEVSTISHVGIYLGNGKFVEASGFGGPEAPQESLRTRISLVQDMTGEPIYRLRNGQQCVGGQRRKEYIFFGSLLTSKKLVQKLRDDWLNPHDK
ncbi:C40 family peptidase [Candidatus Babeliales bacterium]|nr:C40 family peptidase [Candidatus Babeliales bacterium]